MTITTQARAGIVIADLFVLPVSAQEAPKGFVIPLRADEVRSDPTKDITFVQGTIEWVDGRITTAVTVSCSGKDLVIDRATKSGVLDVVVWDNIEPGFCNVLARRIELRK
jgi:hypothetical protein